MTETPARYQVEFRGGPHHGETLRSDSTDSCESQKAFAYVALTDNGRIGKQLNCFTPSGLKNLHQIYKFVDGVPVLAAEPKLYHHQVYRVIDTAMHDGQTIIVLEYKE